MLVAEVSSFQLALTETFHPRAAVLLNITPDHLDWHGSFESYAADKTRIFDEPDRGRRRSHRRRRRRVGALRRGAGARAASHAVRVSRSHAHPGGASVVDGVLALETRGGRIRLVGVDELRIRGPHNVSNALAAAAAAHSLGVAAADLRWGLRTFEPIEHRLEPVGEACGAEWFNDSKATNPDAVAKAIASFSERPMVLLLGGRNKGNDFTELAREASRSCYARRAVRRGSGGDRRGVRGRRPPRCSSRDARSARSAWRAGRRRTGAAVVLSPACASFDEFEDYEDRGRAFKGLVRSAARRGVRRDASEALLRRWRRELATSCSARRSSSRVFGLLMIYSASSVTATVREGASWYYLCSASWSSSA